MSKRVGLYRARPTNRRSKAEMAALRVTIRRELAIDQPMTVRQMYYRLVGLGAIDKTEGEYKATVCRLLALMRREGDVPFGWIADHTRWSCPPARPN